MSEELLNKIFDKLVSMETRITNIEANMATNQELTAVKTELKANIASLETKIDAGFKNTNEANDALLELVEKTYRETEKISQTQMTQGESINILCLRQLQTESELSAWRKAK